jgi:hypothetical protein
MIDVDQRALTEVRQLREGTQSPQIRAVESDDEIKGIRYGLNNVFDVGDVAEARGDGIRTSGDRCPT